MTTRPISEEDLHAFVDETLDDGRQMAVLAYLEAHCQDGTRIEAYRHERQLLRAALAPIIDEPLPAALDIHQMVATRQRTLTRWRERTAHWARAITEKCQAIFAQEFQWKQRIRMDKRSARTVFCSISAAAALLLFVGGISGWWLHAINEAQATGLMTLGHEAAASYSIYATDRLRPVELRAQEQDVLIAWAAQRLRQPVVIPQLSGYRFMGGRVLATTHGAAALFMYDDDKGSRLVILARPMQEAARPMMALAVDDVHGFAWADNGLGYSLVGHAAPETLRPLANEARQQMRENV